MTTQSLQSAGPSPFDADTTYLQKTLRHEPMELALDDSVSLGTLGALLAHALLAWFIATLVFSPLFGVLSLLAGARASIVLGILADTAVFWVVLLCSKLTEPIGEWRTLLADRAGHSESYYRIIAAVLRRRELPIAIAPELRRIQLRTPGHPVKQMIVLSQNEYQIYVTVFPYGTSLYVGWQMWRRRSGAQLIKRGLVDRVKAANLVTVMLRTDRARAVREAVHLACREAMYTTATDDLWTLARQLRLPEIEQETALLQPAQPASPVPPPPSARVPAQPSAQAYARWEAPTRPWAAAPNGDAA